MSDRVLPKPSPVKDEVFTESDWDFYFECRDKLDKPMSFDEVNEHLEITTNLDTTHMDSPDMDEYFRVMPLIPVTPECALAIKVVRGLKAVQELNLHDAKLKYPDEF